MIDWNNKGCEVCRSLWAKGDTPEKLVVSQEHHTVLYQCSSCGTYWEEHERFADVIDLKELGLKYPQLRRDNV